MQYVSWVDRTDTNFLLRKMKDALEKPFKPAKSCPRVDVPISRQQDREEKYLTYKHILRGYIPGYYSGRVVLLHTDSVQSRVLDDPTLGWSHVTSILEVHPIPGDHHTCLTEHVKSLAESLAGYLRNLS